MQRVVAELAAAAEDVAEQRAVLLEVALEQRAGELVLVAEVVEEAAPGDLGAGDDLLDRGGVEALGEDRVLARRRGCAGGSAWPFAVDRGASATVPMVRFSVSAHGTAIGGAGPSR